MARSKVNIESLVEGFGKLGLAKEPVARAMGVGMGTEVRDEAELRAPILKSGNEGTDNQQAGTLRDAIYLAFDKRRRVLNPEVFRYTVSWNSKLAPHGHIAEFGHFMPYEAQRTEAGLWFTPIPNKTSRGKQVGYGLEGGGMFVSAQPFLGPAFDAKLPSLAGIAMAAGSAKLKEVMA